MAGMSGPVTYALAPGTTLVAREPEPPASEPPRLLDRVREAVRACHYGRRTEKAYVAWICRFILFHGKRHPREMSAAEVTQYLLILEDSRRCPNDPAPRYPAASRSIRRATRFKRLIVRQLR